MISVLLKECIKARKDVEAASRLPLPDASSQWNSIEISGKKGIPIAGIDGSYNKRELRSFAVYAVGAAAEAYSGVPESGVKTEQVAKVGILMPYRYIADRLRTAMSIMEIKLGVRLIKDGYMAMFDRSILNDIIRPVSYATYISREIKESVVENHLHAVEKSEETTSLDMAEEMGKFGKNAAEAAMFLSYIERLSSLKNLMSAGNFVAISKTSKSTDYFSSMVPDMAIFEKSVKSEGYSEPKTVKLSEMKYSLPVYHGFFSSLSFTVFYARLEQGMPVLKLEVPGSVDDKKIAGILSVMKGVSVAGYPHLLRKAHMDAKISNHDMSSVLRSLSVIENTGREVVE